MALTNTNRSFKRTNKKPAFEGEGRALRMDDERTGRAASGRLTSS
jgi:hypothetical protein